jgi:hypothetical protein
LTLRSPSDRRDDRIWKVVEATGVVRGRTKHAVDSTILADAVTTHDTITQLIAAIRRVGRQVPGAAERIAAVCIDHDSSQPGKPTIDWDDPAAKDALVSALVNDANALVTVLAGQKLKEDAECAVALLALVAGQDVEPAEDSDGTEGRWRIAQKVAPRPCCIHRGSGCAAYPEVSRDRVTAARCRWCRSQLTCCHAAFGLWIGKAARFGLMITNSAGGSTVSSCEASVPYRRLRHRPARQIHL